MALLFRASEIDVSRPVRSIAGRPFIKMAIASVFQFRSMNIVSLSENSRDDVLMHVEDVIRDGGVAAMPTDTVYGLVCDARNIYSEVIYSEVEPHYIFWYIEMHEKTGVC